MCSRILAGKIYSLVKMPRKAFVGQRGEKLQIADRTAVVDINDVRGACVHRRRQIKSRAEKFLHRFMYRADFKANSRCFREILSDFFLKEIYDGLGFHSRQVCILALLGKQIRIFF